MGVIVLAYTRSVSQLKSVTRCGEAYRLTKLVRPKPPPRPGVWNLLGNALHLAFQHWEASDRQDDVVEAFEDFYDGEVELAKQLQPDLSLWMVPPGTKHVENSIDNYKRRGAEKDVPQYRSRCLEADWEILKLPNGEPAIELEFELELSTDSDAVTVKGVLDRVLFWPKENRCGLEDLKTGNMDADNDARQLGLYALAAHECYDINLTHARYWYTKSDKPGVWHLMSRYTRDYLTHQYLTLDYMIAYSHLLPNPGSHCKLCEVRPYCSDQGWLQVGEEM